MLKQKPKTPQEVSTLGVIQIAHQGMDAAIKLVSSNPERAERLKNMSETLLSASAIILRHKQADVPLEVYDTMYALVREIRSIK